MLIRSSHFFLEAFGKVISGSQCGVIWAVALLLGTGLTPGLRAQITPVTAAPLAAPAFGGSNPPPPVATSPLLDPRASITLPADGLPALPALPTGASDESPTDSGAALAGTRVATTNSQIGVARHFLYQFRVGARTSYDDNIFLSESQKQSDEFFTLSAGVTLGLGDPTGAGNFLRFEYDPDASFYVSHSEDDAVQHSISLNGLYQFTKLTVTGRLGVQILDGTDITTTTAAGAQSTQANLDVNGRTRVNVYTGAADFNYAFSDKTSVDLAGQYSISDYAVLLSSQNLSTSFFFNYAYSPKFTVGAGATAGLVLSESPNPNETYYQANLRTNYEVTGKISVAGTVGVELRESDETNGFRVGPVFNINAVYLPFDGTSASLSASRQTTPSAVDGGQSYETTDLSISFRQRFFQRFFVSLTAGYENNRYVSEVSGVAADREDNYFYVQPGLDFLVHENISVNFSALHRESTSTVRNAGFDDNQISIGVAFSF